MTTRIKVVDGVEIPLTDDEIADLEASAAAADLDFTMVRGTRNSLLTGSDWTQLADSPLSDSKTAEWATYRQALRDLPANYDRVSAVVWPTEPT